MTDSPGVRALIGYDIVEGVSVADYEHWLAEVHYPDLLSNPYLERLVTNDVIRPIPSTLAGAPTSDEREPFYRVVELHFADRDAYDNYLEWFELNPIASLFTLYRTVLLDAEWPLWGDLFGLGLLGLLLFVLSFALFRRYDRVFPSVIG